MLSRLRRRAEQEHGFTLIELLVVILIIGILAAIAIPTFLNQRGKAYDSNAESMVKSAQIAEETYATGNNGNYATSTSQLQSIDPSLNDPSAAILGAPAGVSGSTYTVMATALNTSDVFSIVNVNGAQTDLCSVPAGAASNGSPGACSLTSSTGTTGTW